MKGEIFAITVRSNSIARISSLGNTLIVRIACYFFDLMEAIKAA
jgi:hypothetical protein